MNRTISGLMLALLAIAGAAPSYAAERSFGGRQQFQQQRMQQGTRSGDAATRGTFGNFQRGTGTATQSGRVGQTDRQLAYAGRRDGSQDSNRQSRDIQREPRDGGRQWSGQHDARQGDGQNRHWGNNDHSRSGDNRHFGWDHNRGNHYGWDHNRGNHYGWANDRGHFYGHDGYRGRPTYGWDRSIDARQHQQRERIQEGLRSGELTRHEAGRLFAEQRDLNRQERAFRSDGVVTPWERREMNQDLNTAGRHIYNETHDAQARF